MSSSRRLDYLDALRGLAAVLVFLTHAAAISSDVVPPVSMIFSGHTGVYLFFIISAFSLCYTMPNHLGTDKPLLSFYVHRCFRILPLFYAVFFAVVLYYRLVHSYTLTSIGGMIVHLLCLNNFVPSLQTGVVWASWTISVEMLFYAAFPFLYLSLNNAAKPLKIALALMVAVNGAIFAMQIFRVPYFAAVTAYLDWSIIRHTPYFMMGIAAFYIIRDKSWGFDASRRQALGLMAVSLVLLYLCTSYVRAGNVPFYSTGVGYLVSYLAGIGYMLLFIGVSAAPLKIFVNRVTLFIGKVSFSFYLLHPIVIYTMKPWLYGFVKGQVTPAQFYCLSLAAITPVLLAASWVSYRLIERPGMLWGRRILARRLEETPRVDEDAETRSATA